ncbi:MAG: MurR/RpiR family transcriptional regulator [Fibrobacteria bacterium]|nr:MurR/RpiR family transcriptional regulator [Fibrobacteria bacterium]
MRTISAETSKLIPHSCLVHIQAVYDSLKTAERMAVDFIIDNAASIAELGIVECASRAGSSETTFVRASRKLGYDGFPALKDDFTRIQSGDTTDTPYGAVAAGDKPLEIAQKVFNASVQALKDTLNLIDDKVYDKAVAALINAEKIMFCGLGDAAHVAMAAYQKFFRITGTSLAATDTDMQLILASHLNKDDVLITISHSGKSRTVLDVTKAARQRGAIIISITNFPFSPLAKAAHHVLLTADFEQHLQGEVASKRISQLALIESLYTNYLLSLGKTGEDYLSQTLQVVQKYKI